MKIVNIVASGSFNQKIDLAALSVLGDRYSYNREKYIGGYLTLSSAKVTIYRTGNYIIYGIKSVESISSLWEELVSLLFTHLDVSLFAPPEVKNIVGQSDLGQQVNLSKLIVMLRDEDAEYEPEVFPGLIWKTEFGAVNMFQNGKVMLLGCRSIEELERLEGYVVKKVGELSVGL